MKVFRPISLFSASLTIIIGSLASLPFSPSSLAHAPSCPDVHFVFARGSGAPLAASDATAWQNNLRAALSTSSLHYSFYELGSGSHGGFRYPAREVGNRSLTGSFTALGALISAGEAYSFGASVNAGVNELTHYLSEFSNRCPQTKFVLGGYSQGAMVISKAIHSLDAKNIIYASSFGDPKLHLPEGRGQPPVACQGKNLSSYRAYVPDCHTYEGLLSGHKPYQPTNFMYKLGAWCNHQDLMCGADWNFRDLLKAHLSYDSDYLYRHASQVIAQKIAQALPAKFSHPLPINRPSTHDTAILIDSTESMENLINTYKTEAKRLAQRSLAAGGRIALYEYRDLADPFQTIQHCDFSCSYQEFTQKLDAISTANGGDQPESALSGLLHVMNTLKWQQGANKSIVLLTDSGYHLTDQDGTTLAEVTKRSLEIDPVNIFTITPGHIKADYQTLTAQTGGQSFDSGDELSFSSQYILQRPVASLSLNSYSASPHHTIIFDASASTATTKIDHYEWDLDFDGQFELSTTQPFVHHSYPSPVAGTMQVKVVDQQLLSSTMSAPVIIAPVRPPAHINDLRLTPSSAHSVRIDFTPSPNTAKTLLIINDSVMGFTSQNHFTVQDLKYNTRLSLIPIATDGHRGLTASTTLTPLIKTPDSGLSFWNKNYAKNR